MTLNTLIITRHTNRTNGQYEGFTVQAADPVIYIAHELLEEIVKLGAEDVVYNSEEGSTWDIIKFRALNGNYIYRYIGKHHAKDYTIWERVD